MITLPIKRKWFDMILSGEKKEEYREMKPYYKRRFSNHFIKPGGLLTGNLDEWLLTKLKFILPVRFRNGYASSSPSFVAVCQLCRGKGKLAWGAEPGKEYYILKINRILDNNAEEE